MSVLDLTQPSARSPGALEYQSFNFPDGQPHVSVSRAAGNVLIRIRLSSSDDLVRLLLAKDALERAGTTTVDLSISYLMGARMDRPMPIDDAGWHPATLRVIADVINAAGFQRIALFEPHSDVAPALLNATAVPSWSKASRAVAALPGDLVLVAPDAGASKRVEAFAGFLARTGNPRPVMQALKHRDSATGKLSKFELVSNVDLIGKPCLIVDDIIDGGRTFTGVAERLRSRGATSVNLFVAHGIFSAGFDIEGLDQIFTTNSYRDFKDVEVPGHVTVCPWA